jgi:hypothetical protein
MLTLVTSRSYQWCPTDTQLMARKTPQQKKRDSYEKDRRNTYGERGARSRFAIVKAKRNRRSRERAAARRATELALVDPERAESAEGQSVVIFGGRWRKIPDQPLGDVLERKVRRRQRDGGMPRDAADRKRARIRKSK